MTSSLRSRVLFLLITILTIATLIIAAKDTFCSDSSNSVCITVRIDPLANEATFIVQSKKQGWVGIGVGGSTMATSSMYIGWKSNITGSITMSQRATLSAGDPNSAPLPVDSSVADFTQIDVPKNFVALPDSVIVFAFTRPLKGALLPDAVKEKGMTKFIYAASDVSPKNPGLVGTDLSMHAISGAFGMKVLRVTTTASSTTTSSTTTTSTTTTVPFMSILVAVPSIVSSINEAGTTTLPMTQFSTISLPTATPTPTTMMFSSASTDYSSIPMATATATMITFNIPTSIPLATATPTPIIQSSLIFFSLATATPTPILSTPAMTSSTTTIIESSMISFSLATATPTPILSMAATTSRTTTVPIVTPTSLTIPTTTSPPTSSATMPTSITIPLSTPTPASSNPPPLPIETAISITPPNSTSKPEPDITPPRTIHNFCSDPFQTVCLTIAINALLDKTTITVQSTLSGWAAIGLGSTTMFNSAMYVGWHDTTTYNKNIILSQRVSMTQDSFPQPLIGVPADFDLVDIDKDIVTVNPNSKLIFSFTRPYLGGVLPGVFMNGSVSAVTYAASANPPVYPGFNLSAFPMHDIAGAFLLDLTVYDKNGKVGVNGTAKSLNSLHGGNNKDAGSGGIIGARSGVVASGLRGASQWQWRFGGISGFALFVGGVVTSLLIWDHRVDIPRVTCYCAADSYDLKTVMVYLKEKHRVRPQLYDECLYISYEHGRRNNNSGGVGRGGGRSNVVGKGEFRGNAGRGDGKGMGGVGNGGVTGRHGGLLASHMSMTKMTASPTPTDTYTNPDNQSNIFAGAYADFPMTHENDHHLPPTTYDDSSRPSTAATGTPRYSLQQQQLHHRGGGHGNSPRLSTHQQGESTPLTMKPPSRTESPFADRNTGTGNEQRYGAMSETTTDPTAHDIEQRPQPSEQVAIPQRPDSSTDMINSSGNYASSSSGIESSEDDGSVSPSRSRNADTSGIRASPDITPTEEARSSEQDNTYHHEEEVYSNHNDIEIEDDSYDINFGIRQRARSGKVMMSDQMSESRLSHISLFQEGRASVTGAVGRGKEHTGDVPHWMGRNEVFLFEYGVIVLWNFSEEEEKSYISTLKPFATNPTSLEAAEIEDFHFQYDLGGPYQPRIFNDMITLKSGNPLIKLTISHGIAQSAKLTHFEDKMDAEIVTTTALPKMMAKYGEVKLKRDQIIKIVGRLFRLRVNVNLISNVLDKPEFFWSEPDLEGLYNAIRGYLEISQRVKLLNNRAAVIADMLDMLTEHLNGSEMTWITMIIIILIVITCIIAVAEIYVKIAGMEEYVAFSTQSSVL
ncbi:hypothetical protein HDU76_012533 [Blyttiomyces sp. JEL0837]|nr:hypothetical protein HDU76_012533 [Blyttiomyces sp. JEL0837]